MERKCFFHPKIIIFYPLTRKSTSNFLSIYLPTSPSVSPRSTLYVENKTSWNAYVIVSHSLCSTTIFTVEPYKKVNKGVGECLTCTVTALMSKDGQKTAEASYEATPLCTAYRSFDIIETLPGNFRVERV